MAFLLHRQTPPPPPPPPRPAEATDYLRPTHTDTTTELYVVEEGEDKMEHQVINGLNFLADLTRL